MKPRNNIKEPIWKQVEKRIASLSGGRLTPASGSGNIKGDIRLKNRTSNGFAQELLIEAKSTQKNFITLQRIWFVTLDQLTTPTCLTCLYLYINNKITLYIPESINLSQEADSWETKKCSYEDLPDQILTKEQIWKKKTELQLLSLI